MEPSSASLRNEMSRLNGSLVGCFQHSDLEWIRKVMTAGTAVGAKEMSQVLYGSIKNKKRLWAMATQRSSIIYCNENIRVLIYEHIMVGIIISRLDGMNWIRWDKMEKHRLFPGWIGRIG